MVAWSLAVLAGWLQCWLAGVATVCDWCGCAGVVGGLGWRCLAGVRRGLGPLGRAAARCGGRGMAGWGAPLAWGLAVFLGLLSPACRGGGPVGLARAVP